MHNNENKSLNLFKSAFIGLLIGFIVLQFTGIAFVYGVSMEPTLKEGSLVILNKVSYKVSEPNRGNIVGIKIKRDKFINDKNRYFIKRIIAIPGDHLIIKDKEVILNGEVLTEMYSKGNTLGDVNIKIPNNYVFVMGDNRNNSSDSRDSIIGLISYDEIIGKIINK